MRRLTILLGLSNEAVVALVLFLVVYFHGFKIFPLTLIASVMVPYALILTWLEVKGSLPHGKVSA